MVNLIIVSGIATLVFLIINILVGVFMSKGKPLLKYHKIFASLTVIAAITHVILGIVR